MIFSGKIYIFYKIGYLQCCKGIADCEYPINVAMSTMDIGRLCGNGRVYQRNRGSICCTDE